MELERQGVHQEFAMWKAFFTFSVSCLAEVGQALGRLDPLARQIGQTAERHRLRAEVSWEEFASEELFTFCLGA